MQLTCVTSKTMASVHHSVVFWEKKLPSFTCFFAFNEMRNIEFAKYQLIEAVWKMHRLFSNATVKNY